MKESYPLTVDQRNTLAQELSEVREKIESISILARACFGERSQFSIRAEETLAALQRLEWALERQLAVGQSA